MEYKITALLSNGDVSAGAFPTRPAPKHRKEGGRPLTARLRRFSGFLFVSGGKIISPPDTTKAAPQKAAFVCSLRRASTPKALAASRLCYLIAMFQRQRLVGDGKLQTAAQMQ